MGKEDAGAKKTHKCCNRLDHREVHCAPRAQSDRRAAQSKRFSGRIDNPDQLVILRNTISVRGNRQRILWITGCAKAKLP
jgi:hypothetical protein